MKLILPITPLDPIPNTDDGSCFTEVVYGCTIDSALNYNALAHSNDGSCQIEVYESCSFKP